MAPICRCTAEKEKIQNALHTISLFIYSQSREGERKENLDYWYAVSNAISTLLIRNPIQPYALELATAIMVKARRWLLEYVLLGKEPPKKIKEELVYLGKEFFRMGADAGLFDENDEDGKTVKSLDTAHLMA